MPMIPYVYHDLRKIIKTILELIIKTDVITKCQTLSNIDISDRNNFKKRSKMHLGFQAEKELKSLLQKDLITFHSVSQFKKDACLLVTKLLGKLLEKTPLNSSVIRNSAVLKPLNIINESAENNCQKMKYLLHHLMDLKIVSPTFAEKVLLQYCDMIKDSSTTEKEKYAKFNSTDDRFDKFYFHTLTDLHLELDQLMKLILTLSHGQASIERGFNVNKFIDHVNMEENSLISRKLFIDHMKQKTIQPDTIMKNGLNKSAKAARKRYDVYLEKRRSEKKEGQKSKQLNSTM